MTDSLASILSDGNRERLKAMALSQGQAKCDARALWTSNASIPPLYQAAVTSDFADGDVLLGRDRLGPNDLAQLAADGPMDVFISGSNGSGKSHLAAALAKAWNATWVDAEDINILVKSTYRRDSESSERSIVKEYRSAKVLVIDDVSAMHVTDKNLSTVLSIIGRRIVDMRPTIVTSCLGLSTIDTMDSNLASRLSGFTHLFAVYNGHKSGDRRVGKSKWKPHS